MTVVRTDKVRLMRALRVFFIGAMALFAGCGGNSRITYGTIVISVHSASGGFLSYRVGIAAITLTRSDGIVVEPLATPQSVDFTRLDDIAELVGSPAVPVGTYTAASITLDYSAPNIWVDQAGQAVALAPVNTAGTAMTAAAVSVTFDPNQPLVINAQQSTRLALEVSLPAANTVKSTTSPPTVVVHPFVSAASATVDAAPLRARGLYVTQPGVTSGFIMNARPFTDEFSALGAETVNTTAQTYFNVNGTLYTGAAGLAALAQVPQNTLIVAYGTLGDLAGITPTFNATQVYAGLIVQTPLADEITGTVSARSGDTLTVHGATLLTVLNQTQFFNNVHVTLGSGTIVTVDGSVAAANAGSVSVGQQVTVFGQPSIDASQTLNIDATAGVVRLQPTRLWGTLNSATAGSASLTLLSLENFEPTAFNFAGTGAGGQNANPAAYVVDTGATDESATAAATLLRVDGLVTAFGAAPPDFIATSITPGSATTDQELVVTWTNAGTGGGTVTPFSQTSAAGLIVNLSNANLSTDFIRTGPTTEPLTSLPSSPLITTVNVPQTNLQLAIGVPVAGSPAGTNTHVSQASSAADLVTAITAAFTASTPNPIYSLVAVGQYDRLTNTFNASKISINLY
ncbi:MAG: hypothetical protein PVSMB6_03910 [Steroidobacteraceae bacterium]